MFVIYNNENLRILTTFIKCVWKFLQYVFHRKKIINFCFFPRDDFISLCKIRIKIFPQIIFSKIQNFFWNLFRKIFPGLMQNIHPWSRVHENIIRFKKQWQKKKIHTWSRLKNCLKRMFHRNDLYVGKYISR